MKVGVVGVQRWADRIHGRMKNGDGEMHSVWSFAALFCLTHFKSVRQYLKFKRTVPKESQEDVCFTTPSLCSELHGIPQWMHESILCAESKPLKSFV